MRKAVASISRMVVLAAVLIAIAIGVVFVAVPLLRRAGQPAPKEVIAVDAIKKIGRLEVFRFSNSSLYSYEKNGTERVAEYIGMGVYSVDLERAEIKVIDNYIRIEVPDVEMTQGAFELGDVIDVHIFEQGKRSKDFGIDLFFESKKDASIKLENEARSNGSLRLKAENNARMIIEDLVRKFSGIANPEIDIVFI